MGQTITFFPEGNAECVFLELENEKRMLMDYANMHGSYPRYVVDIRCVSLGRQTM